MAVREPVVRRYRFTIENYDPADERRVAALLSSRLCLYGVAMRGEVSGVPRINGFVNLQRPVRGFCFQEMVGSRAAVMVAHGSDAHNRWLCCIRSGTVWLEVGTPLYVGKKSSPSPPAAPEENIPPAEPPAEEPTAPSRRNWRTELIVAAGPTGSGKSRWCAAQAAADAYWKSPGPEWPDYEGQADVVLDNFDGWLQRSHLLRLADGWPYRVPVGGGKTTEMLARRVFVSTPVAPELWYPGSDPAPLYRRISRLLDFATPVSGEPRDRAPKFPINW